MITDEGIEFEEIDDFIDNEKTTTLQDVDDDNYDEVLSLTEYSDGSLVTENYGIVAEYENIDLIKIEKNHKLEAKNFVQKVTKFISEFKDSELNDEHIKYLKQVGNFEINNLSDLLMLTSINKQMINNIVARVNAVQAEDYALINSYNNLINQHIKLIKELSNSYRALPGILKKMKTEVLCDQELIGNGNTEGTTEALSENYGETQFNNHKQLLKKFLSENE